MGMRKSSQGDLERRAVFWRLYGRAGIGLVSFRTASLSVPTGGTCVRHNVWALRQDGATLAFTPASGGTMPAERVERRLAAILAADVAGYSHMTGRDEEGTHVRLKEHLGALINPKIAEHH